MNLQKSVRIWRGERNIIVLEKLRNDNNDLENSICQVNRVRNRILCDDRKNDELDGSSKTFLSVRVKL